MKPNHKQLKAALALEVKKLGPLSLASKLDKFPIFDKFFPDLASFWDLDNFWPFDFPDFLAISTSLTPSPPSMSPISSLSKVDLSYGAAVFSIKMSRAIILLKS